VSPASPDNEERRVLGEYDTATRFYSWALGELSRQRGTVPLDVFLKLQRMVEDAREECERARLAVRVFKAADGTGSGLSN
jgi:hypothetical protein